MKVWNYVRNHSTDFIFATCMAGAVGAGIWACCETPKALKAAEEKDTTKEKVIAAGKYYVAPAILEILSIGGATGCMIQKNKTISGLSVALATGETVIAEYRDKVAKLIGTEKAKEIDDEITKDHVERAEKPKCPEEVPNDGKQWIVDEWTGIYFRSTPEEVRSRFNDVYDELKRQTYVSVNDYIDILGEGRHIGSGDDYGWNNEDSYRGAQLPFEPEFVPTFINEITPVVAFRFKRKPRYNFTADYHGSR